MICEEKIGKMFIIFSNISKKNRNFQGKQFFSKSWKKGRTLIFFQMFLHESSTKDVLDQKNKFLNLAGYTPLKYVISGKPLIVPKPEVGKFQN
jgi:hypothetical protein